MLLFKKRILVIVCRMRNSGVKTPETPLPPSAISADTLAPASLPVVTPLQEAFICHSPQTSQGCS